MNHDTIDALLQKINNSAMSEGNPRTKAIVNRIVRDLFYTIEDLDVMPNEFWSALNYLTETGQRGEYGLLAAGLGFEHFLDVRLDEAEKKAGLDGGTPRTIEGPLYVTGVPEAQGHARIDDGTDPGQTLVGDARHRVSPRMACRCRMRWSRCGTRTIWAITRTSTNRSRRSICAPRSAPTPKAVKVSAAWCRWATACRRAA